MAVNQLSYETDIAPLKQQYFQQVYGDPRINPKAAAALTEQFSSGLDKEFAAQQELRDRSMVTKSRELDYERTKFTLEREREKAQRDRSMLNELLPLQQQLLAVYNDPNKDNTQKRKDFGVIGVQNAGLFAVNPAAGTAYNAALQSLVAEDKPKLTLGSFISSGGDTKYLKSLSEARKKGQPIDENTAISPFEFAEAFQSSKQEQATLTSRAKAERSAALKQAENLKSLVTLAGESTLATSETGKPIPDKFAKPVSDAAIRAVINTYGTEDEQKAAAGKNAEGLITLVTPIIGDVLSGRRGADSVSVSDLVRSGFTSKPK